MDEKIPSPSAERHQQEQLIDAKVNKELGTALMYFKSGNQELGQFFLQSALEEAAQKNLSIPLPVVAAVMDGKSSQENAAALNPHQEPEQQNAWLEIQRQELKGRLLDTLEPLRTAVEKTIKAIVDEMRNKMGIELELSPELSQQ